ncbi:2'-5' RNA ligase family protein [Deinococcus arenicola]|uniref:2'-5' RNA ligase family protein n=1 Tax=Deinococcus arenicola TaxID=2994950 RepID=A0ABU4DTI4_9DEIO|nr:2'-5' RNA ligase family protein [Deinococcus sp. ZS9-10]MDV6375688.1 2'-5' RNA ligase family protein [Deinococcus sp. ZS9-10]
MTHLLPPIPEPSRPLYSLVAWPPQVLDTWMRRAQAGLNVSGFGLPHLNLRAPFQSSLDSAELVGAFREGLRGTAALDVRVRGWKRLSGVVFLEFELDPALADLHARMLAVGPSSRAPYDGADYRPHLTLALGILPWAEDLLWEQIRQLTPPLERFTVEALSLTREQRGEVQELHTFPLITQHEEPHGQEYGSIEDGDAPS